MSFEIKYDRNGEVVTPAPVLPVEPEVVVAEQVVQEDVAEEVVEQAEAIGEEPKVSEQEYQQAQAQEEQIKQKAVQENFRALRDKAERMEQERNEYQRLLAEAQAKKAESSDEDFTIGDDDLAEGKHLKKLQQEVKKLKQQSEQATQRAAVTETELRLKSQYPDFEKVVSSDNITAFRSQFPELAMSIHSNPDVYSKAVSAYMSIKNLGIHKEDTFVAEKVQTLKNAAKPKPLASIAPQKGDTPLSHANAFANGLTDDLRAQLIKEMNDSRKGY